MDGFKNSTKTQYTSGGSCYAKGGAVKGAAKISKVMGEFKSGKLHSGSKDGPEVTSKKQATAIALSEARKAGAKIPLKKAGGGLVPDYGGDGTGPSFERRTPPAKKAVPKKAVPVAPKRPLVGSAEAGDQQLIGRRGDALIKRQKAREDADIRARQARAAAMGFKEGGEVKPVKKGLGGLLKKAGKVGLGGAAGLIASGGQFPAMSGLGMIQQLLKKKQSGAALTPAEQSQVAQAAPEQAAYKKGGAVKRGVPVAPKGPLVGLAAMPKGK